VVEMQAGGDGGGDSEVDSDDSDDSEVDSGTTVFQEPIPRTDYNAAIANGPEFLWLVGHVFLFIPADVRDAITAVIEAFDANGGHVAYGLAAVTVRSEEWQRVEFRAEMDATVVPATVRLTVGSVSSGRMQVAAPHIQLVPIDQLQNVARDPAVVIDDSCASVCPTSYWNRMRLTDGHKIAVANEGWQLIASAGYITVDLGMIRDICALRIYQSSGVGADFAAEWRVYGGLSVEAINGNRNQWVAAGSGTVATSREVSLEFGAAAAIIGTGTSTRVEAREGTTTVALPCITARYVKLELLSTAPNRFAFEIHEVELLGLRGAHCSNSVGLPLPTQTCP
jgi:hypothetical protein